VCIGTPVVAAAGLAMIVPMFSLADLVDTFDPPNTNVVSTQLGTAPGTTIETNGPAGDFLRLVHDGINNQVNHYTYDRTDAGRFDNTDASFLFRIKGANGVADGFHFMLVPTADFGLSGDGPNPTAEEPNWANTFAIGIDAHPPASVNDVSLHWDGFELVNDPVPPAVLDLDAGVFHKAEVSLRRLGNSSIAKLTLTPDAFNTSSVPHVAFESIVPMMFPYENRVQLGGRTGGSDADMDIDNLSVAVSVPTLPIVSGIWTRLGQSFDYGGETSFVSVQHRTTDQTWFRPGALPRTDGDDRGVYLRLVHDSVNTCRNSIAFDHTGPSLSHTRRIAFDFRMASAGWAADGWSLILPPTATRGLRGGGVDPQATGGNFEEPNVPGALAVGFDLHPEDTGANDVSLHWNGSEVTNVTVDPGRFDLNNAVWNRGEVTMTHVPSGTVVSVVLYPDVDGAGGTNITPIDAVFVPGLVPYEHRVQFGARTGGRYMDLDLDNITGEPVPFALSADHTAQDFEGGGTRYEVWKTPGGGDGISEIRTDGPTGNYLRLVDDGQKNHRNSVVFDQTEQGRNVRTRTVTLAQVDFRAHSSAADNPADGFGFMLIATNGYDCTGPGAVYLHKRMGVEKPNLPGVLGVGIDLYSEAQGVNDVSLHWDGAQLQNVRLTDAQIDLDAGVFHHLELAVEWADTGSTVSVTLTPDINGTPGAPVKAIERYVAGLTPYDFRVELAARTGGATADIDLDNVHVETSGEPGTVFILR